MIPTAKEAKEEADKRAVSVRKGQQEALIKTMEYRIFDAIHHGKHEAGYCCLHDVDRKTFKFFQDLGYSCSHENGIFRVSW